MTKVLGPRDPSYKLLVKVIAFLIALIPMSIIFIIGLLETVMNLIVKLLEFVVKVKENKKD